MDCFTPGALRERLRVERFIDAGGKIFITLLKMLVVPLVFVSLVCGAASLGDTGSVGRLGGKTIGLYLLTTAIAVSMAMLIALTTDPGLGGENANQIQPATAFEPDCPQCQRHADKCCAG